MSENMTTSKNVMILSRWCHRRKEVETLVECW